MAKLLKFTKSLINFLFAWIRYGNSEPKPVYGWWKCVWRELHRIALRKKILISLLIVRIILYLCCFDNVKSVKRFHQMEFHHALFVLHISGPLEFSSYQTEATFEVTYLLSLFLFFCRRAPHFVFVSSWQRIYLFDVYINLMLIK